MSYNFPEFVELYDTRYGKFSFYRTCKAGKHVKGRVLQVIRLSNEGDGGACYHLGSLLSHKQAALVSQTRGRFVSIAGFCHENSILPIVNMSPADCSALRNWESSYGAAVRQQTVHQETTIARHGTLPELCTRGNARSQISLSPFRVSKGRCLEPWSPEPKAFFYLEPRQNC